MPFGIVLDCRRGPFETDGKYPGANRELYPDDAVIGESEVAKIFPINEETLILLRDNGDGPPRLHDHSNRNGDFHCYRNGDLRRWVSEQAEGLLDSLIE